MALLVDLVRSYSEVLFVICVIYFQITMDDSQVMMEYEVSCDPVREFLLCKLAEVREENEKLERQIEKRAEMLQTSIEETSRLDADGLLTIQDVWQKVHNDHWIVGVCVRTSM